MLIMLPEEQPIFEEDASTQWLQRQRKTAEKAVWTLNPEG